MKRRQIAVCDGDLEYTIRFAEYANQQKNSLFLVHGFGSCETLLDYVKEHPVDILLLGAELAEEVLKKEQFAQVFLLVEEEYQREKPACPVILKYQSCRRILNRVLDTYADGSPGGFGTFWQAEKTKRIGIYSPVGRLGKTSFALAFGQALAKQKKTLYLNLEEYSGFETLYPYGDGWTLSELMYFLKQGKNAFTCKLQGMIQQIGGLDYIPPLKSPVELRHIGLEDWELLFGMLEKESPYEIILLDLSGAVHGLYEILERCDGIYTPISREDTAQAKLNQYEQMLKLLELEGILEKTQMFELLKGEELETFIRQEETRWIKD